MKLLILIFAVLCLWLRLAMGADLELAWNASPSAGVTGYIDVTSTNDGVCVTYW